MATSTVTKNSAGTMNSPAATRAVRGKAELVGTGNKHNNFGNVTNNSCNKNGNIGNKHNGTRTPSRTAASVRIRSQKAAGAAATVSATGTVMTTSPAPRSAPQLHQQQQQQSADVAAVMRANATVLQDAKVRSTLGIDAHGKCLRHRTVAVYSIQNQQQKQRQKQQQRHSDDRSNGRTNSLSSNAQPESNASAANCVCLADPSAASVTVASFGISVCSMCKSEEDAGGDDRDRQRKSVAQVIRRIQSLQNSTHEWDALRTVTGASSTSHKTADQRSTSADGTTEPQSSAVPTDAGAEPNTGTGDDDGDSNEDSEVPQLNVWWKSMLDRCVQVQQWTVRRNEQDQLLLQQRLEDVEAQLVAATATANASNEDDDIDDDSDNKTTAIANEQYNKLSQHFQSQIRQLEQVVDHVTMEKDATISGLQARLKAYEATIQRQSIDLDLLQQKCDKQERTITNELRMIKAIAVKRAKAAVQNNANLSNPLAATGITAVNNAHHFHNASTPNLFSSHSNMQIQSVNKSHKSLVPSTQLQLQQPQHPNHANNHSSVVVNTATQLHSSSGNFSSSSESTQKSIHTRVQNLKNELLLDSNGSTGNIRMNTMGVSSHQSEAPPVQPQRKRSEQTTSKCSKSDDGDNDIDIDDEEDEEDLDGRSFGDDADGDDRVTDPSEGDDDINDDDVVDDDDDDDDIDDDNDDDNKHHASIRQERLASLTTDDLAKFRYRQQQQQQQVDASSSPQSDSSDINKTIPPPPPPPASTFGKSESFVEIAKIHDTPVTAASTPEAASLIGGRKVSFNQQQLRNQNPPIQPRRQSSASSSGNKGNNIDDVGIDNDNVALQSESILMNDDFFQKPESAVSLLSTASKKTSKIKTSKVLDAYASPKADTGNRSFRLMRKLGASKSKMEFSTSFEPSERPQRRSLTISMSSKPDPASSSSSHGRKNSAIYAASPYSSEPRRGIKQVLGKLTGAKKKRRNSNNSAKSNGSAKSNANQNENGSGNNISSTPFNANSEISFTPEFLLPDNADKDAKQFTQDTNCFNEEPIQNDPLLQEAMKELNQSSKKFATTKPIMEEPENEEDWDMTEAELGGVLSGQRYLEVNRGGNLSPVSALTTGSYLLDKGKLVEDEGPHKGLNEAAFTKRLPLEEDFDSDDEDGDDEDGNNVDKHYGTKKSKTTATDAVDNNIAVGAKLSTKQRRMSQQLNTSSHHRKSPYQHRKKQLSPRASPSAAPKSLKSILSNSARNQDPPVGILKSKSYHQPPQPARSSLAKQQSTVRRTPSKDKKHKRTYAVRNQTVQDKYGDSGEYTGTVSVDDDLPHGYGKMKYANNRQYEGDWKDGRWHGFGRWMNPNGDCYEGTFVYDARHGSGTYKWENGNVYEGDFFEDKREGNGKFHFANGNTYEGDFVNGVFEGIGRYEFEGGFYEGQWKAGHYHGKGLLLFTDGGSYKGDFQQGVAHGRGKETSADGTVRSGYWKDGEAI